MVDPGDVAALRGALATLLEEFRGGGFRVSPNEAVIETFDRERQAATLAGILSAAVARGGPGGASGAALIP